jgi:glc operon protein GlcG
VVDVVKVQRQVTYAAAAETLRAALAKADELGVNAGVVVTDARGEIVAAGKTEGAGPKTWRGGLLKATSAAGIGRSTEEFLEKRLKQDEVLWRALSASPETFFVPGGVPLVYDGATVGAVGVSGGVYTDDARVAQAGADRFAELSERGEV